MIPTSTRIKVSVKEGVGAALSAVVIFVAEGSTVVDQQTLSGEDREAAGRVLAGKVITGKAREVGFDLVEAGANRFRRVYVVGLGAEEQVTGESVRQAAGAALRALRKHRIASATFVPGAVGKVSASESAEAIVTGVLLAAFDYREYRGTGQPKDDRSSAYSLDMVIAGGAEARAAVNRGKVIADGQNFARTIASRPGNDITPPTLAKAATEMAGEVGLSVKVLDEKEMARLGMGGILGVGAGSIATPPRMIVLEHNPSVGKGKGKSGKNAPLLVVGKAITFDTGGISIKPADKMGKMIYDKCGAMAVLGLMYVVATLKLPVRVVGILSSAENAISEKAYRPGDILRLYNGVTVEVTNTDAEGRLVLADALAWGIETYKPTAVVDLATLTGGVVTALGKTMAGVMANDDGLVADLTAAGELAGEKMWRLPVGPDQRDAIKSDLADIVNSAGREAAPLLGGAFLSYFVPAEITWAHLDIAGVADTEKELPYYGKGATGWGVRTLVEWVSRKI